MSAAFDFNAACDRQGTWSLKYNMAGRGKPEGVLPMWVADMDFPAPPCVGWALGHVIEHGVFGYSEPDERYYDSVIAWFVQRHGWTPRPSRPEMTPGVVNAIYLAVRAYSAPGEAVLIQEPVYYPFAAAVRDLGRKLVVNELVRMESDGRADPFGPYAPYSVDLAAFEQQIVENKVRLFLLCSPHNPAARVWRRDELSAMADVCLRHGVVVFADEIHADLVFSGHRHTIFASLSEEVANITVTATSPSKTFNLAGLQLSNVFIADARLRELFRQQYRKSGLSQMNIMGLVACKQAYLEGKPWLSELLAYLAGNFSALGNGLDAINASAGYPLVRFRKPEGTYLCWLDFTTLMHQRGFDDTQLERWLLDEAGLWLSPGPSFGKGGEGHMRLNAACPRPLIEEACTRLARATLQL
jgi:cystathionine beta-lyase